MNNGISLDIINSDKFLDMAKSAQALYFHLCVNANEFYIVRNVCTIMRMVRASNADLEALKNNGFITLKEEGHGRVFCAVRCI